MNVKEEAVKYHEMGYNCAQSVVSACGKYTNIDESTLLALSSGLGGGVRCGEICGSVTGAALVLGACFPYLNAADKAEKARIAVLTKECTDKFREHFGCIRCIDMKKAGISCNEAIEIGAEIAENIIIRERQEP